MAWVWTYVFVALAAFAAGAINAFAGGGTFLTFPTLTGAVGLSEKVANMTSTIGLWPGSGTAVLAARPEFRRLPRHILILYSIISLVGGGLGSWLLLATSERSFALVVPWLLAFATLIFGFSKPIARWSGRHHGGRSVPWELAVAAIQLVIATYGGYFGAGMGVLMLAGLSFAGLEDIHQINALKVLLGAFINGVAVVVFIFGHIDWRIAGTMAVAAALGGFVGMSVARKVPQRTLRTAILVVGILLSAAYFWKAYMR